MRDKVKSRKEVERAGAGRRQLRRKQSGRKQSFHVEAFLIRLTIYVARSSTPMADFNIYILH